MSRSTSFHSSPSATCRCSTASSATWLEVGYPTPRFDARAKVTGEEKYAIDHYPEDVLWVGARRAGIAHGAIRAIDLSAAREVPGVFKILTRADITGTNRQGIVHKDQPVLAGDKVRHCGDPVALVLAEDRQILKKALALIRVDIEPLPAVFDPEEALRPDAPRVHETGNLLLSAVVSTGNAQDAFGQCDIVIEGSFETAGQEHAFFETQNGLAWREPGGRIVLTASTQAPFRDRFEIAHALGLEVEAIRVISPYLGGGFGGKDGATVQCLLALAALHSEGRPVKMCWERAESFVAGYKRHPVRMRYRLGAKRDGTLHAVHCRLYYDTGAYAHLGAEVMALGMEHAGGPPAGDTLPPLYTLNAEVELRSKRGVRRIELREFITGPGMARLEPQEILAAVWAKNPTEYNVHHFEKVGLRNALACSIASLAALLRVATDGTVEKAAFAWGSVGPTIVECREAEEAVIGRRLTPARLREAAALVQKAVTPISDVRAGAEYRRVVAGNLLLRLTEEVDSQAAGLGANGEG